MLADLVGGSRAANGLMIEIWLLAYSCAKERSEVPIDLFNLIPGNEAAIKVGLAEIRNESVYIKGSSEAFHWIHAGREQRVKAGIESAKSRKEKYGSAIPKNAQNHDHRTAPNGPNGARTDRRTDRTSSSSSSSSSKEQDILCRVASKTTNTALAASIVNYLNKKAGTRFRANSEAHTSLILARHKEGASEEDLKRVIDIKTEQWKQDPKMSQFLRPSTLFGKEKFSNYLGENFETKEELEASVEDLLEGIRSGVA